MEKKNNINPWINSQFIKILNGELKPIAKKLRSLEERELNPNSRVDITEEIVNINQLIQRYIEFSGNLQDKYGIRYGKMEKKFYISLQKYHRIIESIMIETDKLIKDTLEGITKDSNMEINSEELLSR